MTVYSINEIFFREKYRMAGVLGFGYIYIFIYFPNYSTNEAVYIFSKEKNHSMRFVFQVSFSILPQNINMKYKLCLHHNKFASL